MSHDPHEHDHDHGHDHHGHDHHHGHGHHHHEQHEHRGGAPGTEFLDLEVSQLLAGQAGKLAREVAFDLMREAIYDRLKQRLGARFAAVGQLAADELADDIEANLDIEARIRTRREAAGDRETRLRAAFETRQSPAPAPRKAKSKR
jgi:ABC-type Zn2+ transport system substrate-binding protein/surface adhesin